MNDMKRVEVGDDEFPIPAEMLENPAYRHRYFDDEGNMLPVEELQRIEEFWRSTNVHGDLVHTTSYHGKGRKSLGF